MTDESSGPSDLEVERSVVPPSTRNALDRLGERLRTARQAALRRAAVPESDRTWEYAGRTWSWPTGESMRYFRDLAPGERNVLDRAVEDRGWSVAGVGTGRVVVRLPTDATSGVEPLVAKLARYGPSAEMGAGRPQNRRERRVWRTVGGYPFLPVRGADADGDWLVMPAAEVPTTRDADGEPGSDPALDRVREALAPYRHRFHFDELKPENVGRYDGRYWVLDYGRPTGEPLFVDPPE